jgi:hypothetical protein
VEAGFEVGHVVPPRSCVAVRVQTDSDP